MKRITPSVSLNEEEQKVLESWQKFIGEPDRSKSLKAALFFADNVAHKLFGGKLSGLLQRRIKYDKLEKEYQRLHSR